MNSYHFNSPFNLNGSNNQFSAGIPELPAAPFPAPSNAWGRSTPSAPQWGSPANGAGFPTAGPTDYSTALSLNVSTPPLGGGGNTACFSKRYDGKPLSEPKECYRTFTHDSVRNILFEDEIVNGTVKKRTAIAKGFHFNAVVECINPMTGEPIYYHYFLETDREYRKTLAADISQSGNYRKHMPEIDVFPGVSNKTVSELIASQIARAPSYKLILYPHHGFIDLPDGSTIFASATETQQMADGICTESIMMRKLMHLTEILNGEAVISLWRSIFCSSPKFTLLGLIMVSSILLYFCEQIKIHPDFLLMIRPSDGVSIEQVKAALCLIDWPLPNLECRDSKITDYISKVWDAVALFLDYSFADEGNKIEAALRTLIKRVTTMPNGDQNGRSIIAIVSQNASYAARHITDGNILFLPMDGVRMNVDYHQIHFAVKGMESLIISTATSRFAEVKAFFEGEAQQMEQVDQIFSESQNTCCSAVKLIRIAAHFLQKFMGIDTLSEPEIIQIFKDLADQKDLILDADKTIVNEFAAELSLRFRTGEYSMLRKRQHIQIDPNGRTAIVDGNRLYLSREMIQDVLTQMKTTHNFRSVINALKHLDSLAATDGDTHPIKVHDLEGESQRLYWYDISAELLDVDVLFHLENIDSEQLWLNADEVPEHGFLELLRDASGRVAGKLIRQQDAENNHIYLTGQSGAGKTYTGDQLMAKTLRLGHHGIAFDNSASSTYEAMCRNLSKEYVDTNVAFIDIDEVGIPVDLFRIDRTASKPTQKRELRGILTAGVGELTAPQRNKLNTALSQMLDLIGEDEPIRTGDILAMLDEDGATYESLRSRFEPLFEDIDALGMASQSWGEVFRQHAGKIIVIRTASGSTEHGDQLIDMMLASLFSYQKENPEIPLDVFIDELQNQNLSSDSSIYRILKEGRKFGIAFFGATQDFYPFNTELGKIMSKADTQIFLRPTPNSAGAVASVLRFKKAEVERFDAMQRGDAIIKGFFYSKTEKRNIPATLSGKIAPFVADCVSE